MRRGVAATLVALLLAAVPASAVQTGFWELSDGRDWSAGEFDGLSLRPDGEILLAPDLVRIPLTDSGAPPQPFLWRGVLDSRGNLYLGSGIRGLVYRVDPRGEVSRFFVAPELQVHALAIDSEDRLLVGSSPSGRVYRVQPSGEAEVFFEPQERYIWDMAVTRGDVLYVATGEHGTLYRVDPDGEGEVLFDSDEPHLVSLAVDIDGSVVAGSSGSALVYKIGPDGSGRVLFDADGTEVGAVALTDNATVFAAVNHIVPPEKKPRDEREKKEAEETLAGELPTASAPGPEGMDEFARSDGAIALSGPRRQTVRLRSSLYRIPAAGGVERIWEAPDEGIHALLATAPDRIYFGTGVPGRLYVHDGEEGSTRRLGRFVESQVTALAATSRDALYVVTSNQGHLYRTSEEFGSSGSYTSTVRDAGGVARWGRVAWEAETPAGSRLEISTRSGNSARPDSTWSEWSPAYTRSEGTAANSPPARYLQFRARLSRLGDAPSPRLRAVRISYLEGNLPPRVWDVRRIAEEDEPESRPTSDVTTGNPPPLRLAWSAEDPNGDALTFELLHRREQFGEDRSVDAGWQPLAGDLREPAYTWDTTLVEGGRYRLKVRASDAADNDASTALSAAAISEPFILDHDPPHIEILSATGARGEARIAFRATDEVSPVVRVEYSLPAAGTARRIRPVDGLDDSRDERYEVTIRGLAPGPHVVRISATDREGNRHTRSVTVEVKS